MEGIASPQVLKRYLHNSSQVLIQYLFGIKLFFALAMFSSDFGAAKWHFGLSLDGRSWSGGESNLGRFTP